MRGVCFRCKALTQTAPGPTGQKDESRATEVALVELDRYLGYRYDDNEDTLLICSRCMAEVVGKAIKERK
jgi:hypothetical protein